MRFKFTADDFKDFYSHAGSAAEVAARLANKAVEKKKPEPKVCGHDAVQTLNGYMCFNCRAKLEPNWAVIK